MNRRTFFAALFAPLLAPIVKLLPVKPAPTYQFTLLRVYNTGAFYEMSVIQRKLMLIQLHRMDSNLVSAARIMKELGVGDAA